MSVYPLILLFTLLLVGFAGQSEVPDQHQLIRRLAVFPIFSAEVELGVKAEDAWWDFRENLVRDGFFFVASRRLMTNRGVFKPRRDLSRADAILLAKIVEAQAVVTLAIRDKRIFLKAYDGSNGQTLLAEELAFYPAAPIQDQVREAVVTLAKNFRKTWPYQAFQVFQDTQLMAYDDRSRYAKIYVGRDLELSRGDEVQWIQLPAVSSGELFENPTLVRVVAEGRIAVREGEYAQVEVAAGASNQFFFEGALVRLPGAQFGYKENIAAEQLYAEYGAVIDPQIRAAQIKKEKQSPATTGVAFLLGLAAFILLAF